MEEKVGADRAASRHGLLAQLPVLAMADNISLSPPDLPTRRRSWHTMATKHAHSHDPHAHAGMPKIPSWLTVEDALDRILGFFHVLDQEERPLLDALGQVLVDDVHSAMEVPPLPNTTMDG